MNDPLLGRTIDGRYEILDRLGEGGMGVVYRARQVSVDRPIAIKVLNQHMAADPSWVQRFYNEAKASSRLTHPNTIRMFDFGQTSEGLLFMTMEYLDGQSLRQAVASSAPMAPARVLKILVQCCASLSEAHGMGIIHRDIKPDNVFLLNLAGSPDFVKLLDFSVAKLLQENEQMRTQAGVVFGTPQYMSPEQGRGLPLDASADLYALGILAFEMLTGRVPFTDDNPMTVLQMHLRQPLPPLPEHVPPGVRTIVARALEKDPNHRYRSSTEMMQHCQHVLAEIGAESGGAPAPRPQAGQQKTMMAEQAPQGGQPPPPQPAAQKTMMAKQAPPQGGPPPGGAPAPQGGPPPGQAPAPQGGPPPGQPPAPQGGPPPGRADDKTMMAGQAPDLSNLPPRGGGPQQPAAQKTMMADAGHTGAPPNAMKTMMADGSGGPPPAPPEGYGTPPPMPGGGQGEAPAKTMMLQDSEGVVSFAQHGRSAPVSGVSEETGATAREGASTMFWIVCLCTGLAVGVGAYVLVLQLS